jgi:hypothetical protein
MLGRLKGLAVPLIVWGITLCAVALLVMRFGVPLPTNKAVRRAERLAPLSMERLRVLPLGSEVLVEGRIAGENSPLFRSFVAYDQSRYRKTYKSWEIYKQATPPLVLEVPGGSIRIANSNYALLSPPFFWKDDLNRYQGFRQWDSVMAIGTLSKEGDALTLSAELLYGGSRASYIAGEQGENRVRFWLGPVLLGWGLGFALAGVALKVWRRRGSPGLANFANESPAT